MVTPKEIKDYIIDAVGDLVGTYTYKNGVVLPAISIGNPPNDVRAEGLEVIIPRSPQSTGLQTNNLIHRRENWRITLLQRSGDKLYQAADRLSRYFPWTHSIYFQSGSPQQSEMVNFTIRIEDLYERSF